ncbi:phosphohydrolase [Deinococcus irradiatisoli]|uniref:Phosphohydrolase n=1 Tax=Deinococcus irradiatisoli TaxID=2202254 RepID=A0A2Z3JEG3_9DEIO|nr:phosphohydrolase [Deinococcus irradiatisoli]AWN23355.1 phosphohydrolase [Deinococcus irradiatisoli]
MTDPKFTLNLSGGALHDVEPRQPRSPVRSVEFATPRAKLIEEADRAIRQDLTGFPRALAAYDALQSDPEALADWDMANYITMRKLGYNDHGRVHAFITGAASLAILELLLGGGVRPDIIESGIGDTDDVYLTVLLGTMLHDIGNQIHRASHEQHGVTLALPIINRILEPIYPEVFKRTKIRSFILGCVNCHDLNPPPLTIEAGITAVADGTDITKGRGRKAFALGSVDIHSISALAVDQVVIERGVHKPVRIDVTMNNSGGIFQVEEVLAPKVIRTPLARYVELHARTRPEGDEQIVSRVRLDGDHFVMDLDSGATVQVEVEDTQARTAQALSEALDVGVERK